MRNNWVALALIITLVACIAAGQQTAVRYPIRPGGYRVTCVDSAGNQLWYNEYGEPVPNGFVALFQVSTSEYRLVGQSTECVNDLPHPNGEPWVAAIDTAGTLLWSQCYAVPTRDLIHCTFAAQGSDGRIIVGGTIRSRDDADLYKSFVSSVASNGDTLWSWIGTDRWDTWALCAAATADGGCVVAGLARETDQPRYPKKDTQQPFNGWMTRLDNRGHVVWARSFDRAHHGSFDRVVQTSDGGFLLAGDTRFDSDSISNSVWFVRTNARGKVRWQRNFAHEAGAVFSRSLVATEDSYFYSGLFGSRGPWILHVSTKGDSLGGWNYRGQDAFVFGAKEPCDVRCILTALLVGVKSDSIVSIVATADEQRHPRWSADCLSHVTYSMPGFRPTWPVPHVVPTRGGYLSVR
jgi:hypothetical protein